ncbi:MAG: aminoglycoside phosphotransferase family protein [Gammaproteobacteria bacterium]|nr:aminoglycoside phosphotransferase family protein [Gammaproteobacteria bacterium]
MRVELTPTKVRRIVQENTEICVQDVSLLGAGFDFETYLVNDEWVFRFPNTPSEADALVNENHVLNGLSIPTTTPVYEHWLSRPTGYPMPVAGYRVIRGECMEALDPDSCDTIQLAKDLAKTLQSLHGACVNHKRHTVNLDDFSSKEVVGSFDPVTVGLTTKEQSTAIQFVEQYRNNNKKIRSTRIHGDLGVEHIITKASRYLVGVIDWSNATIGNRFKDFIGLWGWGGDHFVQEVLSHYQDRPQHIDWAFIRVHGLMYCVHRLKLAVLHNHNYSSILCNRLRKRIKETRGMSPSDLP